MLILGGKSCCIVQLALEHPNQSLLLLCEKGYEFFFNVGKLTNVTNS